MPFRKTYDDLGEYLSRLLTSLWVTSCTWPSLLTCLFMLLTPAVSLEGGANDACAHGGNMGSRASVQRLFPPCITAVMQVLARCYGDCCFSGVRDNTSRRSAPCYRGARSSCSFDRFRHSSACRVLHSASSHGGQRHFLRLP